MRQPLHVTSARSPKQAIVMVGSPSVYLNDKKSSINPGNVLFIIIPFLTALQATYPPTNSTQDDFQQDDLQN